MIPDDADDNSSRQDAPEHYNGEQGTCSWDELLFEMTNGEMGTPPRSQSSPRRPRALGLKPKRGTPLNDGHKTHQQKEQSGR